MKKPIDIRVYTCYYIYRKENKMKVSELTKILKKNGCFIVRRGSRHDIWKSTITGNEFPVPRHPSKEIPTGTLNNILKAAGLK